MSTKDAEKEDKQSRRAVIAEWNNVGHVPFKEKDKIYKQYQGLLDILFKKLNMHGAKTNVDNYASNINKLADNGKNTLYREREKLMRVFESLKNEVKNYENNIGFLSSNTKGGNQLVKEMERKIEKIKNDMQVVVQKIDLIDEKLQA